MNIRKKGDQHLSCVVRIKNGIKKADPTRKISTPTARQDTFKIMKKFGLSGNYTHKSFKVSGITTAFDKGVSRRSDDMWEMEEHWNT